MDEEEEELLSQHSQRTVPKEVSQQGRRDAQQPAHSAKSILRGFKFFVTGLQPLNETEQADFADSPMLREEVCELILRHGGVLEEDIERLHPRDRKSTYDDVPAVMLISDRTRTTIKYLSALAAGIPCVHHLWIKHCISDKLILPFRYVPDSAHARLLCSRLIDVTGSTCCLPATHNRCRRRWCTRTRRRPTHSTACEWRFSAAPAT